MGELLDDSPEHWLIIPELTTDPPSTPAWPAESPLKTTRLGRTRKRVVHYKDLLVGSISLMGTSAVLGIAGFLFWVVVARFYPITEVGHATAMVSAIILLSTIGVFGLGTVLIGELSLDPRRVDPLLPAALGVTIALSALMAGVFAFGVALLPSSALNHDFDNNWSTYVIFIVSVAVASGAGVFDQVSLGLRASHMQFLRNTVMSVARLVAVVALAVVWGRTANSLLAAWTAAVVFSMFVIVWPLRRRGIRLMRIRSPRHLRGLMVHSAHHTTLNMALSIPRLIMPIVVAAYADGITTAVFYVCWMIAMFLYMVPAALSTTLFVIAVGDNDALRKQIRVTLTLSAVVGLVCVPAVALFAHPLLSLFGAQYAALGATTLALLIFLYIPNGIKQHYAAISRARNNVRFAGWVCGIGALCEIAVVAAAMRAGGGILVASGALCIVLLVEAVFMSPSVVGTLRTPRGDEAPPSLAT
ncbi:MAG: hypothetical protein QOK02_6770 [Mycobacterium sp.]|jgi:O-antigen/teichoic acid export membrane protein|nr:hypothetical protein [Mycobacterium sp.]